jgi:peptide/nickel transport system substrate-binding protein
MKLKVAVRIIALVAVVSMVGAACSKKATPPVSQSSTPGQSASPSASAIPQGGSVVFGAEQWPQCLNPITSCSFASWYYYSVAYYVFPRAMIWNLQGQAVASPLLTEAPSLDNGGITQDPFTVTFHINPKAVWADGSPITSADFDFTNNAVLNTKGTVSTTGYSSIDSIDTSDPATAVIKFKTVFVDWMDLFGGAFGVVLEKAAFPSEASQAKVDLSKEMNKEIPFAGGPWKLQSWSKNQAVLVRNDKYWDHQPYLDQVTWVPREDQPTEINSLLSGEVSAIFPQPSNVSIQKQVASQPNAKVTAGNGIYYEALWFNEAAAPLDDPKVREALGYAIDRQAIIDSIIKINNPNAAVLNCGFYSFPGIGPWCEGDAGAPFSKFTYDPAQAQSILTSDGYDCSKVASGGYCQKNGKDLTVVWSTVAGNTRRESTQALELPKAKAAGIKFVVKNYEATDLFSNKLPKGDYQMADYAQGGVLDPSITSSVDIDQIPSPANQFAGANTLRWKNQQASDLAKKSDEELDQNARLQELQQIYALEAQDVIALPLYQLPQLTVYRSDVLAGPIGQWNSTIYGGAFNFDYWYCIKC